MLPLHQQGVELAARIERAPPHYESGILPLYYASMRPARPFGHGRKERGMKGGQIRPMSGAIVAVAEGGAAQAGALA